MYEFKLYISSRTLNSAKTIEDLKALLRDAVKDQYKLKIINIDQDSQLTEEDNIIAVPTLIKVAPPPIIRIIGDLGDKEKLLKLLFP